MTDAKAGDTVAIHYTGTLTDGAVFDSSDGRDPLQFVVGSGQIIPGLDQAIPGMKVGDKKVVEVPADQAYGQHNPQGVQAVPREHVPAEIPLEVGLSLQMQTPDGRAIPVVVTAISEAEVTLDANHPLAGKDLTFAIEIMEVKAA